MSQYLTYMPSLLSLSRMAIKRKRIHAFGVSAACTNKVSVQATRFPSCWDFAYPIARTMNKLVMNIRIFIAPNRIYWLHKLKGHNKKTCTFFLKYNKMNILFEKSCKQTCQLAKKINFITKYKSYQGNT